jgi:transcriptional regulator with XRE-family HTH domain
MTLGQTIRARRKKLNLTQEALAAKASMQRTHLVCLEGDDWAPSLKTLARIASALGTTTSSLLAKSEPKQGAA